MECSTRRMEQIAKLLAEEIEEKMVGQEGINEMEGMMREMVKEAANLGMQHAIEQGEETSGSREVNCPCGQKAQFVSKRSAVLWTVFGKVNYHRRYYLSKVSSRPMPLGSEVWHCARTDDVHLGQSVRRVGCRSLL